MWERNIYSKIFSKAFDIPVAINYWDGTKEYYGGTKPKINIKIKSPIPLRKIVNKPTLVLGEAYMNGQIEIKGSIEELIASAFRQKHGFLARKPLPKFVKKFQHSTGSSKNDIQEHYDIGNDFYKMWLDKTLTYSCAYFRKKDDTLEQAQKNKIMHVLYKLKMRPNKKLLDIGCGWGTLLFIAAQKFGVQATGITLSQEQYNYIRKIINDKGLEGKVNVKLADYRKLHERYDYITSIGMFEHVGKENLGTYFKKVKKLLKVNGRALIHGITGQHNGLGVDPFLIKYIFPGGYIPNLAENLRYIMNAGLQISDLESLRRHYQRTLEIWYKNYSQVVNKVAKKYSKRFARMWSLYLQACAGSFKAGNIDVFQYLLVNGTSGTGLPMTRDYIYEEENKNN